MTSRNAIGVSTAAGVAPVAGDPDRDDGEGDAGDELVGGAEQSP
jgi:hypothetical protein